MCGLAGWFDAGPGAGPPPGERSRRAALDALAARGPDGEGVQVGPHFGLLHRRLAIVDRAGGAQPMAGPREGQWLAWNGELFDHDARRRTLESRGETFATRSDTEVLARLLARQGTAAFDPLVGQFAVAWVDGGSLVLARDPRGEKPLFWRRDGDRILFASTLDALHALAPSPRTVDREALSLFLSWGFVPAPRTFFAGVHRLAAGEWIAFARDGRVETGRIAPPARRDPIEADDAPDALRTALAEAARIRLESSDLPVGVFLSGGLDSLAVAAALRGRAGLRTFTVRSLDPALDETSDAARIAAALGVEHEIIDPPPSSPDGWRASLLSFGEPFAIESAIAVDVVARAAKRHVTVVLTGDGGDEALGGYERHRLLLRLAKLPRLPQLPVGAGGPMRRVARALEIAAMPPGERYAAMYEVFGVRRARLSPGDDGRLARELVVNAWGGAAASDLDAMLRVDRAIELPDAHCVKIDGACMGSGVEARCPWLDPRVQAVCDAMPAKSRTTRKASKVALRAMLRRDLPAPLAEEVLSRTKRGFSTGFAEALRSGATRDLLFSGVLARVGGIDQREVEHLWSEHKEGRGNHRIRVFVLTTLALFADARLS